MSNSQALIFLIFLTILSAFFSGSETGMMAINRYRLKHMAKKGHSTAKRVQSLLSRPDKLLSTILIGNTFANLLYSSIFTQWAIATLGDLNLVQSLLLTLVSSLIIMIFAESAPKTFAALHPQSIAFATSMPLKWLLRFIYPIVWFVSFFSNNLLRLFGVTIPKHNKHYDPLSHEELKTLVHESSEQFPAKNTTMLIRLLDLHYATVEDAMIPRNEIIAIDINNSWSDIQKNIINWPYSHILFYEDDINNMLGFVHLKKVLNLLSKQELNKDTLKNNLEECYFIPESTTLTVQLLNFQQSHKKSGLVVDEYGDIMGLISLQDILEEVVGEFEQTPAAIKQDIKLQADNTVIIEGSANIRDINRELNWELPENGPKTISGLIIEQLETIPDGLASLKIKDYNIEILKINKNTIKLIKAYK